MIQEIINGIAAALLEAFPGVKVYTEQIKQGLEEPCFIVRLVNPTNKQLIGLRYHKTNLFSIRYIPKSITAANAECNAITETLFQALEYITVGEDLQRGKNMRSEYFDNSLVFLVNYDMFVKMDTELDPMEILTVENQTK